MVFTRGKRPSAVGDDTSQAAGVGDAVGPLALADATPDGAGEHRPLHDGPPRKRRRSASPPADAEALPSKRHNLRKAPSPVAKRTSITSSNVEPSREKAPSAPTRIARRPAVQDLQKTTDVVQSGDHGDSGQDASASGQPAEEERPMAIREISDVAPASPDMDAVMSQIIHHGESVDAQHAHHGEHAEAPALANLDDIFPPSASAQLKTQSLPVLDNLAVQVLAVFASSSYQEILALTADTTSDPGAAYSTLKSLFDHAKKVYSIREPFLSPRELGFKESDQADIIRKANLATFVSSVFGSQDVGFYHLDEFFLDTFVADGSRLLKTQAGLFLDLKTQAYISAVTNGERTREDILQDLFPNDLDQRLLNRRSGAKQPSPGEADFIQRAGNRKKALLEEPMTAEAIAQLPEKYVWEDFLRDVSSYISKNFNAIVGPSGRKISGTRRSSTVLESDGVQQSKRQSTRKPPQGLPPQEVDADPPATNAFRPRVAQMVAPDTDDIAEKAARAAEFAMQDFSANQGSGSTQRDAGQQPQPQPQAQQYPFHFEQQPAPYYTQTQFNNGPQLQAQLQQQAVVMGQGQSVYLNTPAVPFPTQSAPTSVLYERARMAATAKASPSNRRAGHPSQRRPWTQEEENALMHGLDHVKGPHWSQILAMYGPGGTLNETLKDRNQVQLKDKARNLKLFFLKSGIEVPYYLQFVTGELKTRAPQAARQAEQRELSARQEGAGAHELDASVLEGGQAAGGAGDGVMENQETNMEDGEGEFIDPAEYAAVHGAGSQEVGGGEDTQDSIYADAQQQLSEATAPTEEAS
ncbi:MAG: hypothetical protein LQ348_003623 [Seirophora lacunosa]|nr:MAG: hypothetical protein LQ348_003623 [Seirophora lacunosa]